MDKKNQNHCNIFIIVNYSDTSNRASCFVHRGYYHTRMEQFSHSVHKR